MRKLEGENRIEQFREIARRLAAKIGSLAGVEGIVYMGGLVRGFADKYSDVDIIVFLSEGDENLRGKIREISVVEQERSGVDIDLEIHNLSDFRKREFDEYRRWDFLNARIIFDPHGRTSKLLNSKTKVPKLFWRRLIVEYGEYLRWYCCPPKEGTPNLAEMWIDRGDLVSAHYCLNYSLDLLFKLIFAVNKEPLPAPKWIVHYSCSLKWLPSDYGRLLEETMTVQALSIDDLNRRLKAMRKMCADIFTKIEHETKLTPELITKQYVKKLLYQI